MAEVNEELQKGAKRIHDWWMTHHDPARSWIQSVGIGGGIIIVYMRHQAYQFQKDECLRVAIDAPVSFKYIGEVKIGEPT